MKNKILITGTIVNTTPLKIGSGEAEITDSDILLDINNRPYIPASSFCGALKREIKKYTFKEKESSKDIEYNKIIKKENPNNKNDIKEIVVLDDFWGKDENSNSAFSCEDLACLDNKINISTRDNIRVDNKTGQTKNRGKFNYQILEKNHHFQLTMIIDEREYPNVNFNSQKFAQILNTILTNGFSIGAKVSNGFGKIKAEELKIYSFDMSKQQDILNYIKFIYEDKLPTSDNNNDFPKLEKELAFDGISITGRFKIKRSLIIRDYNVIYENAKGNDIPDSFNIKDKDGKNILTGSSLKGALRARAEKIINTIFEDKIKAENLKEFIFGTSEEKKKEKKEKKEKIEPSRFLVDESLIDNCIDNIVHRRNSIDRFTGGTIEGALFDSIPVYSKSSDEGNVLVNFTLNFYQKDDRKLKEQAIGIMLLTFKDLWEGDLLIGGEKCIGRGALEGVNADIDISNNLYKITKSELNKIDSNIIDNFNKYIKALYN